MVKFNLGCGCDYKEGYINVDTDDVTKKDLSFDLEKTFPMEDNSVDEIVAQHIIEHLHNFVPFMNECHRVLLLGGKLFITTPKPNSEFYWQDPTHVRGYVSNTFTIYFSKWCGLYSFIKRWSIIETKEEIQFHNGIHAEILFVEMTK